MLRYEGIVANHKHIRRLMRLMDIHAIYPRKCLSRCNYAEYIYPYLLRGRKYFEPNSVWSIDITYIPMRKGFMYLTAIIDVASRFIVGWALSNTLEARVSIEVLDEAIAQYGKPEILNSDQGSQFTCPRWINKLPRCMDKVMEVVEEFTPKEEQNIEKTYLGKIINIGAEAEVNSRNMVDIKIATIGEGMRTITVNASLNYSEYFAIVDNAFQTGADVKITGIKTSTARSIKLNNARIELAQ